MENRFSPTMTTMTPVPISSHSSHSLEAQPPLLGPKSVMKSPQQTSQKNPWLFGVSNKSKIRTADGIFNTCRGQKMTCFRYMVIPQIFVWLHTLSEISS